MALLITSISSSSSAILTFFRPICPFSKELESAGGRGTWLAARFQTIIYRYIVYGYQLRQAGRLLALGPPIRSRTVSIHDIIRMSDLISTRIHEIDGGAVGGIR